MKKLILKRGDIVVSRLEIFKKEMEPSKELYANEIVDFSKKFDAIGEMTLIEQPILKLMKKSYHLHVLFNQLCYKILSELVI